MSVPRRESSSSIRRDSLGLPPLIPRSGREGSVVSNMSVTVSSSWHRSFYSCMLPIGFKLKQ